MIRGLAEGSSGLSTAQLAGLITGTPQFQALYPPAAMSGGSSGADKAFSNALISRVLGSAPLSAEARAGAFAAGEAIMAEALKAGQNEAGRRATLINAFSDYLGAIKTDPAQPGYDATQPYLAVARQLANKVVVADYYTTVLKRDMTDIGVLRDALARVSDKSAVMAPGGGVNAAVVDTLIRGFDAATQQELWTVLKDLVEKDGLGPDAIVGLMTGTPQFQALYPPTSPLLGSTVSPAAADKIFSDALISRVLGSAPLSTDARAAALAAGEAIMADALKAGQGEAARRATLANTLIDYLGAIKTDPGQAGYDATQPYLAVARQLANKVTVAEYYTATLKGSATTVASLQQVVSRTTAQSDVSTAEKRALLIDFTPPVVVSFSSTSPDGSYKVGQSVNITASVSEALREGSQIAVTLETGTTDRTVVLQRDGADPLKLVGSYVVQAGDTSTDLTVKSYSLGLGANTPADLAGNLFASTALPLAPNNLGDRKALVIDTVVVQLSQSGRIQDGYIAGATVFADADGDGVLDPGEASAVSDAQGRFSLSGALGDLVATGGKDISTNLAHTTVLKA
ncbi:MAG: hypothetical protein EBU75_11085, partial [Betaproteobacteria bacterium]|nr:hypothetical protein [Betaproteobacteria bacterium]